MDPERRCQSDRNQIETLRCEVKELRTEVSELRGMLFALGRRVPPEPPPALANRGIGCPFPSLPTVHWIF